MRMVKAECSHLNQTLRRLSASLCLDPKSPNSSDENLSGCNEDWKELIHRLESSNLVFYQILWDQVKAYGASGNVIVSVLPKIRLHNADGTKNSTIDIVANYGAQWVKLINDSHRTLTEKLCRSGSEGPIIFDEPFIHGDDLEEVEEGSIINNGNFSPEAFDSLDMVQTIKRLICESRHQPIRIYGRLSNPEVWVIFTRIDSGETKGEVSPEFHILIDKLEKLGANVKVLNKDYHAQNAPPNFDGSIFASYERENLFRRIQLGLTQRLNIDVTVLLALISDITISIGLGVENDVKGCSLRKRALRSLCEDTTSTCDCCGLTPTHRNEMHEATRRQVKSELECPSLRFILRLLQGEKAHELVATTSACNKFYEILDAMGSQSEKNRAEQLFAKPYDENHNLDPNMFGFSSPKIRVVSDPPLNDTKQVSYLSEFNRNIFGYSIVNHVTTISSNVGAYKQIQAYDFQGSSKALAFEQDIPNIVLVQARSLLGNMHPCKCSVQDFNLQVA